MAAFRQIVPAATLPIAIQEPSLQSDQEVPRASQSMLPCEEQVVVVIPVATGVVMLVRVEKVDCNLLVVFVGIAVLFTVEKVDCNLLVVFIGEAIDFDVDEVFFVVVDIFLVVELFLADAFLVVVEVRTVPLPLTTCSVVRTGIDVVATNVELLEDTKEL